jgi:2-desacetyl-2-hydroxyethyl bacteriochlorophyllide A dehydrogenase
MQALQYIRPSQLILTDLPLPQPNHDEVLIEVAYCGICGTDLHILQQESPAAPKVILGHEFSGKVVAKGKDVIDVDIGDRISIDPNNYCGACNYCQKGQVHFCKNLMPLGVFQNGAWAQYCIAPAQQVYKIPDQVTAQWGALAEPISCIMHAWDRIQPFSHSDAILILGSGLIGLLWGLILRHYGCHNMLMSEPNEKRKDTAKILDFDVHKPIDVQDKIVKKNAGFDLVIDCSGSCQAVEEAVKWLNPLGKLLFFGICPQGSNISVEPFHIFQKELTLLGSVINPFTFPTAIQIINHIQIPLEKLDVRFFALQDYEAALKAARSGEYTKVIFDIGGSHASTSSA